jgi:hypothetical protein
MAEMQREMCTDSTQHPTICPKGPSEFWSAAWEEKYGDGDEEYDGGDELPDPEAPARKSAFGRLYDATRYAASVAYEVVVPQSKEDVAIMATGFVAGKALKILSKRKLVKGAVRGGRKAAKAVGNLRKTNYHHLTPRQWKKDFERLGVDVHDLTLKISKARHRRIHNVKKMARLGKMEWNARWRVELDSGRLQGPADVKRFALKMARDYGLPKGSIVRYPGRKK